MYIPKTPSKNKKERPKGLGVNIDPNDQLAKVQSMVDQAARLEEERCKKREEQDVMLARGDGPSKRVGQAGNTTMDQPHVSRGYRAIVEDAGRKKLKMTGT